MPPTKALTQLKRLKKLSELLTKLHPLSLEQLQNQAKLKDTNQPQVALECIPCDSYEILTLHWRKAMFWTVGLDSALATMLASVVSTAIVGDQLWVKVIGPASCGKTTLCEAIAISRKYVMSKSTIRGFHTGWKATDGEDHSLIAQANNKTLLTKDGDALLQAPNISQILSEARDIYDTTSRSHYRNTQSTDYSGIRITWIICGTSSLRKLDSSELGERFLDCVVMESINDDLEDEILWRVAERTERNMNIETTNNIKTQYDPNLALAMQYTGGFVNHLRENAATILGKIVMDNTAKRKCIKLGKLIAFMRARPSSVQTESVEREFAARLVSQLVRLAKCLAAVLNKTTIDTEIIERVSKIALDTARGKTLEIAELLFDNQDGLEPNAIAIYTGSTVEKVNRLLYFMRKIHIVKLNHYVNENGVQTKRRLWILTPKMRQLCNETLTIEA